MPSNVYVIIWENNMGGNKKLKGHTWPGHAAINLGDHFDEQRDGKYGVTGPTDAPGALFNYVSWFPSEGSDFGFLDIFKFKQLGSPNSSFIDDIQCEGYYPDHVIKLACSDNALNQMIAEWRLIRLKPSGASYKAFRKNCSTIVSRVLHAGGFYAQKWAIDKNAIWTPANVLKLALAVGGVQMDWEEFLTLLQSSPGASPADWVLRSRGRVIDCARDRAFCSTGAPCRFNGGRLVGFV